MKGGLTQKIAPASTKLISKLTRKALGNKGKGQQQLPQQFVAPAASSCGTTSSSGSSSSSKPLRKYSSNGVLSVASSSSGSGSCSTADKLSTKDNASISTLMSSGNNNNNNKTSIIIGSNGTSADSGHGDSDHSLASSPHLEEHDTESDDGSDSADSIMNETLGTGVIHRLSSVAEAPG